MTTKFLIHRDVEQNLKKFGLKRRLLNICRSVEKLVDSKFSDYGKNIKHIDSADKIYKSRAGDNFRLFFKVSTDLAGHTVIHLLQIMNHDRSDKVHSSPELLKKLRQQDFSKLELIGEVTATEREPNYHHLLIRTCFMTSQKPILSE
jgi:mRNA-degrading endonuclease RelE of RelBE toxin-antitoxin system